jgi:hypothetical protein
MSRLKEDDKILLVQLYFKNSESVSEALRKFGTLKRFKNKNDLPHPSTVANLIKKFSETGTVSNKPHGRKSDEMSREKISDIVGSSGDGNFSVRHMAEQIGASKSLVHNVLRKELKLYPYKVTISQTLTENHKEQRVTFCSWALSKLEHDLEWLENILFSDECTFNLNGRVNRQNYRFWGTEKPNVIIEHSQYSPKINVWIGMSSRFIIGLYLFEENGTTVNINAERYSNMLCEFLIPSLKQKRMLSKTVFQQDGASSHVSHRAKQIISANFRDRIISRNFDDKWPASSPDLSPLDYWLWSYLKDKIYLPDDMPRSLSDLKEKITQQCSLINNELLLSVIHNFPKRVARCLEVKGSHFEN